MGEKIIAKVTRHFISSLIIISVLTKKNNLLLFEYSSKRSNKRIWNYGMPFMEKEKNNYVTTQQKRRDMMNRDTLALGYK